MDNNLLKKINLIKENILNKGLKKSGKNKFAGFDYYELADFLPTIIHECKENNIFTHITFTNEEARLKIINIDKPEEFIEYSSPMRELELKGCNQIQALGGIETYQRRYLFLVAFDIIEADAFDPLVGQKITDTQIKEIDNMGIDKMKLCKYYGVNSIKDLTMLQAEEALKIKKG